jgi:hypothetical protein
MHMHEDKDLPHSYTAVVPTASKDRFPPSNSIFISCELWQDMNRGSECFMMKCWREYLVLTVIDIGDEVNYIIKSYQFSFIYHNFNWSHGVENQEVTEFVKKPHAFYESKASLFLCPQGLQGRCTQQLGRDFLFPMFSRFKVEPSLNRIVAIFSSEHSYLKISFVAILHYAGAAFVVADYCCKDNSTIDVIVWNQKFLSFYFVNFSPHRKAFRTVLVDVTYQFLQHDLLPWKSKSLNLNFIW